MVHCGRATWLPLVSTLFVLVAACGGAASSEPADGADQDRPQQPAMEVVSFVDVADEVGLDFQHGAFRFDMAADPAAMMGGGLCWLDHDNNGWFDLFVVNTWSSGDFRQWEAAGGLPTSRLYSNERGQFEDVTNELGIDVAARGNGCVAADLDGDGWTDLFVTTDRENLLFWNEEGAGFTEGAAEAGVATHGWHSGAAVADVDADGRLDLFVAGYADTNRRIPEATRGFPNTFQPELDLLFLNEGATGGKRPSFREVSAEAGIERAAIDYGLGALFSDVDRDGDVDLFVANDTVPNRLYVNSPVDGGLGFELMDQGKTAGVDDDNAGMGVAIGDYDDSGLPDLVVTNMGDQLHNVFRSDGGPDLGYVDALPEMGLDSLGEGLTGWGTMWVDLDLDSDLDLVIVHGGIPVVDLVEDRQPVKVFENRTADGQPGTFVDVSDLVGLDESVRYLARGAAGADFDNDGDIDFAVGSIGGDVALLRNSGAGGHWLTIDAQPRMPGTMVFVTRLDGTIEQRELIAGSSYLSSEDPRSHFGLGEDDGVAGVRVEWPDGTVVELDEVDIDQIITVRAG